MLWLFDFVYMEVIIFLCMQDISRNCEWSTLWKLCLKEGKNALILHIKALHTLKLELSYNLDDFHFFISRPSCYMCEVARFMFNTSESDLFISRHASTILYTEAPTITHCNFS